jgi:hypothetical protein
MRKYVIPFFVLVVVLGGVYYAMSQVDDNIQSTSMSDTTEVASESPEMTSIAEETVASEETTVTDSQVEVDATAEQTVDEDAQVAMVDEEVVTEITVERDPEGCPTTKGFLEQVCELGEVNFERMKGLGFRRNHAADALELEGWGTEQVQTCIDACAQTEGCVGVSVRSEGIDENSKHHCSFHTSLESKVEGAEYRAYCINDLTPCEGADIETERDGEFWE